MPAGLDFQSYSDDLPTKNFEKKNSLPEVCSVTMSNQFLTFKMYLSLSALGYVSPYLKDPAFELNIM